VLDGCWLIACLAASAAWCLSASARLSATFDEPVYLASGLEAWRTGSHARLMHMGTMPLPVDLNTLPLYMWERWHGVELDPVADLERILPWARAGTLVFWSILLVYGWLAARQLAGPWGGRLAAAWLACEPNLLAHASLATTDIAISACLLALAYHFRQARDRTWFWRVGLPACWFAAAVLAKASGMVFGPLCLLAMEIERIVRAGALTASAEDVPLRSAAGRWRLLGSSLWEQLRPFWRDLKQLLAIGFVLVFVYCGCDWQPQPSFVEWAHELPQSPQKTAMVWVAEHLCIFTNAGEGLVRQIKHNVKGHHGAFLLGHVHPKAVWYYFPVALSIKLTLALLAAPLVVLLARRRALANWALAAAAALLLFSVNCRVQIGIRLVLPLVVLLIVGLSAALVEAARTAHPAWRRGLAGAWAGAAVLWAAMSAGSVWPHGLCYVNELWGGPANGYMLLSDSNYDWGQGVKELDRWRKSRGLDQLDVWYFGTDPAIGNPPLRHLPLHVLPLDRPADVLAFVESDYLAVGTTLLYGTTTREAAANQAKAVAFFKAQRPVARTTTFLIYDLSNRTAGAAGPGHRQANAPSGSRQ
jgi:hypothetical protein